MICFLRDTEYNKEGLVMLNHFEKCYSLKVNVDKTKDKLIGSNKNRKEAHCNLDLADEHNVYIR